MLELKAYIKNKQLVFYYLMYNNTLIKGEIIMTFALGRFPDHDSNVYVAASQPDVQPSKVAGPSAAKIMKMATASLLKFVGATLFLTCMLNNKNAQHRQPLNHNNIILAAVAGAFFAAKTFNR